MRISGGRSSHGEGRTSSKTLQWKCAWVLKEKQGFQFGLSRVRKGKSRRHGQRIICCKKRFES